MNDIDKKTELLYVIEYCECLISEAKKYKDTPEYFTKLGYADEKLTKLNDSIERMRTK